MSQEEEDLDALGFLDDFASESHTQLNDNDSSNNISSLDSLLNEVEAQFENKGRRLMISMRETVRMRKERFRNCQSMHVRIVIFLMRSVW